MPARGDVIILKNGQTQTGDIVQETGENVFIKLDYGTMRYSKEWIKDIRREKPQTSKLLLEQPKTNYIQPWSSAVDSLAKQNWAYDLKQIPATVIDNGVLKNVPYVSFRCANDSYEMNIYGDLDNPAGIEIGVLNTLLNSPRAKSNCVDFISSVLNRSRDRGAVRMLPGHKILTNDNLTFEITEPDEPDAYGGWWVSVYDENALNMARASGKELLAITEPRDQRPFIPPHIPASVQTEAVQATAPEYDWSPTEITYSRPPSNRSSSSGGQVFVRSYFRQDGTYVHSYTRSAPHSHR